MKARKSELDKKLKMIGRGSSRYVYDAGDGKSVIKYAVRNMKGFSQNSTEYDMYKYASEYVDILCPIIDISDDGNVLIMAKAVPITKSSNLSEDVKKIIRNFKKQLKITENYYDFQILKVSRICMLTEEQINEVKKSSLFEDLLTLIDGYGLLSSDLFSISSWGYLDGKIVLIDYGCSTDCYNEYYVA